MKPAMRKLSPQTKQAIGAQFEASVQKAYARGDDAGWVRGFRVGALLGVAAVSLTGLVTGAVLWALS